MAKTKQTDIRKVADKAHSAIDKAADVAEQVESKAKETSTAVKEQAKASIDEAKDIERQAIKQVSGYINENPMKSVGIAFGIGLLASVLLRKS